ncbi:OmpA family protein [Tenacibaculum sp. HL-MS23]|uniref:OmpA family protein n=1 Tax=Tenacibaculum sp. HL-MS23 TaxID=3077734 RepID=UPI0028FC101D|nr:OmpA family protein [Tenacibaculum sp. HL-MS23]WNW02479.1 OmpA family protein [Tenacibaculum sp. HL-MS23]
MADIKTLDQGAKILQNVDVGSIVTGLALGIADAQERLDTNSVKQITRLSEVEVGGKSLLELGFQPAFYAFEYADVSASINLKMTVQEELEIDFSLEYDSTKKKGYTDVSIQEVENNYQEEKYKEFKSSRKYWTTASNEHTLKVNQSTVNTSKETGSIDRLEETAENLSSDSEVQRVDSKIIETKDIVSTDNTNEVKTHNYNGFGMLSLLDYYKEDTGIIKFKNYTNVSIKIKGTNAASTILLDKSNLADNLNVIVNSTFKFGLKDNDALNIYFDFSKHHALDFSYNKGTSPNNTESLKDKLRALAFIMIHDTDVTIKIAGHTDSVSGDKFNEDLGLKRANTIKNYLITLGVNESQIIEINSEGELNAKTNVGDNQNNPDYRKAVIDIDTNGNEYIFVEGGDFSNTQSVAIVADWSITNSGIVQKYAKTTVNITKKFIIESGSDASLNETVKSLSEIKTKLDNSTKFYSQISGDVVYLLRKDAKIEYTIFSNNNEETTIEDKSSNAQNSTNNNDTLNIHKVINSKYFAKSDLKSIKDPKVSAWSGSLDVRYARQFGVSVEGNASVSARMISVPPPTGLENYIQSLTGNTTSGS